MNNENTPEEKGEAQNGEASDSKPQESQPQPEQPISAPQPAPPPKPVVPSASIISKPITRQEPPKAAIEDEEMDRRSFIKWLTVGWAAFAAIVAGYGTLMLRFLFPNVLFEPKQSFIAGIIEDFTVGEVSERFKEKYGVWVVRDSEKIFALSTTCTHLGCTPNWLSNEGKYKCPCHGSGFYKNGINFEGPAPRPLERFKISLSDDGEIIVDKSKKFQHEKGEWSDPESFILA